MENGRVNELDCPDRGELAAFVAGNLSATAFERIARHVEHCSACETALGALDHHIDPFLSRLRRAALEAPPTEEIVPQELLAVARSSYSELGQEGPRRLGKFE